ncbi:S1 RNA-binding domain-containing protein, partial [Chromobacterium amazonense]
VKAGDVVKVKVLEVDVARKRIALTMRLDDEVGATSSRGLRSDARPSGGQRQRGQQGAPAGDTAMAAAFAKLRKN